MKYLFVTGLLAGLCHSFALPQQLASSIQKRSTPDGTCDLSTLQMPAAPTALPAPPTGSVLTHVAIGRGTQNYSCATNTASSVPVQVGANATLFNFTCVAAQYPTLFNGIPQIAYKFPIPELSTPQNPAQNLLSGEHYFLDTTTPFFDLDLGSKQLGEVACTKTNASNAPNPSSDVPWLHLKVKSADGTTITDVYRLETVGGVAPATCSGQPSLIYVQYAAQYWFYTPA